MPVGQCGEAVKLESVWGNHSEEVALDEPAKSVLGPSEGAGGTEAPGEEYWRPEHPQEQEGWMCRTDQVTVRTLRCVLSSGDWERTLLCRGWSPGRGIC